MTQLRLQLRDAAERDARRGPLSRGLRALRWNVGAPALAIGGALAAAAVVLFVVLPFLRDERTVPAGSGLRVVAHQPLVQQGAGLETVGGAVWAADKGAGEILRVDQETRVAQARVKTGGEPVIVAGDGALWAVAQQRLLRIDPASARITDELALRIPPGVGFPVPGRGVVWIIDGVAMRRVDIDRMAINRRVRVGRAGFLAIGFAFDDRAIYVQRADNTVASYDAGTGRRLNVLQLDELGHLVGIAGERLVFASGSAVTLVDARTGARDWMRELGTDRINSARVSGGEIWVQGSDATTGTDLLWRLGAGDGRVLGSLSLPDFGAEGMVPVGADLWLVSPGGNLTVVGSK